MRELLDIIPDPRRVIFDNIDDKYLTDGLGRLHGQASALVFPVSTQEVSDTLRWAHERRVPVTPRGAGTNLVGSTVPQGGIVLDLSRMNRVLALDADTMTVTVEPGILLQDLQAYVEQRGLFYPPDPGEKTSSIGGNIATNAGGMRAVKYGVTRDYVRGLEVVLADGEVRMSAADGEVRRYALQGGYVEVGDGKVIILADRALPSVDIDVAQVRERLAAIEAELATLSEKEAAKTTLPADKAWCDVQLKVAQAA